MPEEVRAAFRYIQTFDTGNLNEQNIITGNIMMNHNARIIAEWFRATYMTETAPRESSRVISKNIRGPADSDTGEEAISSLKGRDA